MLGFSCLTDVCKNIYDHLAEYIKVIAELSVDVISNGADNCKIPAIELWNVIAQEESQRKKLHNDDGKSYSIKKTDHNIIKPLTDVLLPPILLNLQRVEEEDIEGNTLSVYGAASKCLISWFEVLGDNAIKITVDFIQAYILNNEWRDKVATLTAFGCLLAGISDIQGHNL